MLQRDCRRLSPQARRRRRSERKRGRLTSARRGDGSAPHTLIGVPYARTSFESPDVHICLRLASDTFAATRPLSLFRGVRVESRSPPSRHGARRVVRGGSARAPGARRRTHAIRCTVFAACGCAMQLTSGKRKSCFSYPLGIQHNDCSCAHKCNSRTPRQHLPPPRAPPRARTTDHRYGNVKWFG